jgi:hypothetical protein
MDKEFFVCSKGSRFYYVKTDVEIDAQREADIKTGNVMDSAGESILYSRIAGSVFREDTAVSITKRRLQEIQFNIEQDIQNHNNTGGKTNGCTSRTTTPSRCGHTPGR